RDGRGDRSDRARRAPGALSGGDHPGREVLRHPEVLHRLLPGELGLRALFLVVAYWLSGAAAAATWIANVDPQGLPALSRGGGPVFRFDLANFAGELGEPELLAGNRGWTWGRRGTRVEMRFEPPLEALYFERGAKSELRAFFYKDRIPAGARRHVATLSVSGDIAIGPSAAERFGLDDPAAWPTAPLDWKSSPVDLSFLNAQE